MNSWIDRLLTSNVEMNLGWAPSSTALTQNHRLPERFIERDSSEYNDDGTGYQVKGNHKSRSSPGRTKGYRHSHRDAPSPKGKRVASSSPPLGVVSTQNHVRMRTTDKTTDALTPDQLSLGIPLAAHNAPSLDRVCARTLNSLECLDDKCHKVKVCLVSCQH